MSFPTSKCRRVAIYAHVSTSSQAVENQFQKLSEVARRNGWTIVAELSDSGISGAKGRDQRPALFPDPPTPPSGPQCELRHH